MKRQHTKPTKPPATVIAFPAGPRHSYDLGYLRRLLLARDEISLMVVEEVERLSKLATPEQAELLGLLRDLQASSSGGRNA
jgi:hypothetical protein